MKDDGGPEFPVLDYNPNHEQMECFNFGMTLRDWFAGQALYIMPSPSDTETPEDVGEAAPLIAKIAYAIADAMINERSRIINQEESKV
jgi:hypothetical protein